MDSELEEGEIPSPVPMEKGCYEMISDDSDGPSRRKKCKHRVKFRRRRPRRSCRSSTASSLAFDRARRHLLKRLQAKQATDSADQCKEIPASEIAEVEMQDVRVSDGDEDLEFLRTTALHSQSSSKVAIDLDLENEFELRAAALKTALLKKRPVLLMKQSHIKKICRQDEVDSVTIIEIMGKENFSSSKLETDIKEGQLSKNAVVSVNKLQCTLNGTETSSNKESNEIIDLISPIKVEPETIKFNLVNSDSGESSTNFKVIACQLNIDEIPMPSTPPPPCIGELSQPEEDEEEELRALLLNELKSKRVNQSPEPDNNKGKSEGMINALLVQDEKQIELKECAFQPIEPNVLVHSLAGMNQEQSETDLITNTQLEIKGLNEKTKNSPINNVTQVENLKTDQINSNVKKSTVFNVALTKPGVQRKPNPVVKSSFKINSNIPGNSSQHLSQIHLPKAKIPALSAKKSCKSLITSNTGVVSVSKQPYSKSVINISAKKRSNPFVTTNNSSKIYAHSKNDSKKAVPCRDLGTMERLVIQLGEDSSDEEAETSGKEKLVNSLDKYLDDARKRSEKDTSIVSTPEAVFAHLPLSQRLEYARLKEKLAKAEEMTKKNTKLKESSESFGTSNINKSGPSVQPLLKMANSEEILTSHSSCELNAAGITKIIPTSQTSKVGIVVKNKPLLKVPHPEGTDLPSGCSSPLSAARMTKSISKLSAPPTSTNSHCSNKLSVLRTSKVLPKVNTTLKPKCKEPVVVQSSKIKRLQSSPKSANLLQKKKWDPMSGIINRVNHDLAQLKKESALEQIAGIEMKRLKEQIIILERKRATHQSKMELLHSRIQRILDVVDSTNSPNGHALKPTQSKAAQCNSIKAEEKKSPTIVSAINNAASASTLDYSSPLNTIKNEEAGLDPYLELCPHDLSGVCRDQECPYQHMQGRKSRSKQTSDT